MICFGVSVGGLPADDWVSVLVLLVVWVRHPALGAAGSWVVLRAVGWCCGQLGGAASWIQVEVFVGVLTD